MIPRYSRKEITDIWSEENKYKTWLKVELLACEAWAKLGKIPKKSLKNILSRAPRLKTARIAKIEEKTRHDVIAFLTALTEVVGRDSRFIHMGMTSSDMLDTAFAYQLKLSSDIILKDIDRLLRVLKKRANEFKKTPIVGRSHGIHAEPTSFGLKFALWYAEFERQKRRMTCARRHACAGKISGAVGTFANIPPQIERYVCRKLGLDFEPVSTQIVQRDRHAHLFSTLALIASSIEKIATEVRHLQRTEVLEAEEPFSRGQKGSSAMPHKRNPILSENLCGLARVVRANALCAMENIPLWHERDISHSSAERVIAPDSTILVDFMLNRLTGMLEGLVAYPSSMKRNLDKLGGLVYSQRVLLALIEHGMSRETAYEIVQTCAMKTWEDVRAGRSADFAARLMDSKVGKYLSAAEIAKLFDVGYHLKHVDTIFRRVFNKSL